MSETNNTVRQITLCAQCGKRVAVSTLLPQGFMATVNYHNVRSGCCNAHVIFVMEIVAPTEAFNATTYPDTLPKFAPTEGEREAYNLARVRMARIDQLEQELTDAKDQWNKWAERARFAETVCKNNGLKTLTEQRKPKRSHKKKATPTATPAPKDGAESLT